MIRSILHDGPIATAASLIAVLDHHRLHHPPAARRADGAGDADARRPPGWWAAPAGRSVRVTFLNFIALPITFGIGAEYALNVVTRYREERDIVQAVVSTGAAVALCSWTTIVGYGSLLAARNQALQGFGWMAILGEVACLSAAIIALPAVLLWRRGAAARRGSGHATRASRRRPPLDREPPRSSTTVDRSERRSQRQVSGADRSTPAVEADEEDPHRHPDQAEGQMAAAALARSGVSSSISRRGVGGGRAWPPRPRRRSSARRRRLEEERRDDEVHGLAGDLDGLELADDGDPNLPREASSRARSFRRSRLDSSTAPRSSTRSSCDVDAHLAAALHGERLGDAAEAAGDALQVLELARRSSPPSGGARPGRRARHRVGGGDQVGVGAVERLVGVVGADGVGDHLGLAEAARVCRRR